MKYLLVIFILISTSITLSAQGLDADKSEILKVRKESNISFKNHQIEKILSFLTDDVNIAASNGEIISGKIKFKDDLTILFSTKPDLYVVRTSEVLLNTEKNIGWEKGTWIAVRPNTDNWKKLWRKLFSLLGENKWNVENKI